MTREEAIKILEEEAEFLYGGDEPYERGWAVIQNDKL